MSEREQLYQMLMDKKWVNISKYLYRNHKTVNTDPVSKQAITLFEAEFFSHTTTLDPTEKLKLYEFPSLIIETRTYGFSQKFIDQFIDEKMLAMQAVQHDGLVGYAAGNQHRELARNILKELETNSPEVLADARRENTTISSVSTQIGKSHVIKLFKSQQEKNFFEAVRQAFPTYHPYPNVALSCILDFDKIKNNLTHQHQNYFFKAVVDCVVFDSSKDYIPLYFIELDSVFHDTTKAKENDLLKNQIFEVANTKLIRVRPHEKEDATEESLLKLVLEIMRDIR